MAPLFLSSMLTIAQHPGATRDVGFMGIKRVAVRLVKLVYGRRFHLRQVHAINVWQWVSQVPQLRVSAPGIIARVVKASHSYVKQHFPCSRVSIIVQQQRRRLLLQPR